MGFLNPGSRIAVVERDIGVGLHASRRNTGKVHAPYLYDPNKKKMLARSALVGGIMWEQYAKRYRLPFKRDGVMEIATRPDQIKTLEKYHIWGLGNGMDESDMDMLDSRQLSHAEPQVRGYGALQCHRDASVDYYAMTESLKGQAQEAGVKFLTSHEATKLRSIPGGIDITINHTDTIQAKFVVNAAGGQAVDVAHQLGVASEYTDVHFRGEYWRAPPKYHNITSSSIYQVPKYTEYPFLDPHWIMRVDGTCEVGPNAVPVFSPYGYDISENARLAVPKLLEMISSGARKMLADARFQSMAIGEARTALSKSAMIERVRRFLPKLDPTEFRHKGTSGIRSALIDSRGSFVPDAMVCRGPSSIHILNYNSPGATGALPFAAHIMDMVHTDGTFRNRQDDARCGPWKFRDIMDMMQNPA